jgi:hypothetical protein
MPVNAECPAGRLRRGLEARPFLEAVIAAVADDDVVKQLDAEDLAASRQPSRDVNVVDRRRRIA